MERARSEHAGRDGDRVLGVARESRVESASRQRASRGAQRVRAGSRPGARPRDRRRHAAPPRRAGPWDCLSPGAGAAFSDLTKIVGRRVAISRCQHESTKISSVAKNEGATRKRGRSGRRAEALLIRWSCIGRGAEQRIGFHSPATWATNKRQRDTLRLVPGRMCPRAPEIDVPQLSTGSA